MIWISAGIGSAPLAPFAKRQTVAKSWRTRCDIEASISRAAGWIIGTSSVILLSVSSVRGFIERAVTTWPFDVAFLTTKSQEATHENP